MWLVDIYSKGDLLNDDYLIKRNTDDFLLNETRPRFEIVCDIQDRIEMLHDVIERANEEINLLEKYDVKLCNKLSWSSIDD